MDDSDDRGPDPCCVDEPPPPPPDDDDAPHGSLNKLPPELWPDDNPPTPPDVNDLLPSVEASRPIDPNPFVKGEEPVGIENLGTKGFAPGGLINERIGLSVVVLMTDRIDKCEKE